MTRAIRILSISLVAAALGVAFPRGASTEPLAAPHAFDQATVQKLIDGIDVNHNDAILKLWYFNAHRASAFAPVSGFALLKTAADKEKPGTRRWFVLESTIGWAAVRIEAIGTTTGLAAYKNILDRSAAASKSGAGDLVQDAIGDFTHAIESGTLGASSRAQWGPLLCEAVQADNASVEGGFTSKQKPAWAAARRALGSDDRKRFDGFVSKSADQALKKPRFDLLVHLAELESESDPQRAVQLFAAAEPLVPAGDKDIEASYRRSYVDLLDRMAWQSGEIYPVAKVGPPTKGDPHPWLTKAIDEELKLVASAGRGQGRLAVLYFEAGEAAHWKDSLRTLGGPTVDEAEVLDCAARLLAFNGNSPGGRALAQEKANDLYMQYLLNPRPRTLEGELTARYAVAQWYFKKGQRENAGKVLNTPKLASFSEQLKTASPETKLMYLAAQGLVRRIELPGD